jgi:hypothetical protein
MIVDGAQPTPLVRLPRGGDHDLRPPRAPQGTQGGPPTDSECVRVVKHLTRFQVGAGVRNRLFLPAYSGSGLLICCGGRRRTRPACCRARRTVSSETRSLVCSARSSASRWSAHSEPGTPKLRGRRRPAASRAAR